MRRSLQARLMLSFAGVALITLAVVSLLIRLTSGQSLMNLVAEQQTAMLSESVQTYYANHGSLDGFAEVFFSQLPQRFEPLLPEGFDTEHPQLARPPRGVLRGVQGLVDAEQRALLPFEGYPVGQVLPDSLLRGAVPVEYEGQTIAWILPDTSLQFRLSAEEELFLQRTTFAIVLAGLIGAMGAVALGYLLSTRLLRPIRRLTQASQALARGDLEQRVPVTSQDELGQLTATFNQMSADLARADQQRKRITADITHDLSTPLQIISGYIEMLEEGEATLTPQRLEILKTEIGHLRRLVGDLTTLTQVEAGGLDIQMQPLQPLHLLERIYQAYLPIAARQGIALSLQPATGPLPEILGDEDRLLQVLKNLIDNALRCTPSGGWIRLSGEAGSQIHLIVADSGAGVDPEDLPYVFERFYRTDKARGANSGKMGLGLAICRALVAAHGGTIRMESAGRDQGTAVIISFDSAPRSSRG